MEGLLTVKGQFNHGILYVIHTLISSVIDTDSETS